MSQRIVKPLHVGISVTDTDRSVDWYTNVLGFTMKNSAYVPPLEAQVTFLERDGFEIELFRCDENLDVNGGKNITQDNRILGTKHLAFLVDDMDALKKEFAEKKVRIFLETRMGPEQVMFVTDPDDTVIEFICRQNG